MAGYQVGSGNYMGDWGHGTGDIGDFAAPDKTETGSSDVPVARPSYTGPSAPAGPERQLGTMRKDTINSKTGEVTRGPEQPLMGHDIPPSELF